MIRLILAAMLLPACASAGEYTTTVKFTCTSQSAAEEVVWTRADLIVGLSPLPGGCEWVYPVLVGTVGETVEYIDVGRGYQARINRVRLGELEAFSAGVDFLMS